VLLIRWHGEAYKVVLPSCYGKGLPVMERREGKRKRSAGAVNCCLGPTTRLFESSCTARTEGDSNALLHVTVDCGEEALLVIQYEKNPPLKAAALRQKKFA